MQIGQGHQCLGTGGLACIGLHHIVRGGYGVCGAAFGKRDINRSQRFTRNLGALCLLALDKDDDQRGGKCNAKSREDGI